ncbi:Uma2 family endonuclease [Hymenobacter convexus]|uniref:Uma2 family endonuclease n=1 Tax=Hymenobacter sp. CA1UV-4 TaxID=3063782 RepID=UPI0027142CD4|nr:Uma2 family endonuclease [Hymenobacter sp. CA1UV-4]MDO7850763.1 Uma2 family endonuclease [Hymenobacter sp. CA1UV-4]
MGLPAFKLPEKSGYVSADDYLAIELDAETRHEYANGRVWAMAGAEMAHNDINYNLNQVIGPQQRKNGCKANMSDLWVQTKNRSGYLYPDTVVVCGTPMLSDEVKPRSLTNPVLVVEVTSASTAERDHYEKFTLYRRIDSLRQYLMLSSEEVHAEIYTLDELGRWIFTETRDLSAVLDLSSIGCQVPLAEVYAGVELERA